MALALTTRYRYALVLVAVAMSLTLGTTLALGYWQSQRASEFVLLGQGDVRLESLLEQVRFHGRLASSQRLAELLAQQWATGLRYLAVEDGQGQIVAQAGTASDATPSIELSPEHLLRIGNRIRVSRPFGPPEAGGAPPDAPPPPPDFGPPGGPPGEREDLAAPRPEQGPPPSLVIEFESQLSEQVEQGGRLVVIVGSITLIAFVALCVFLVRILAHRDELVQRLERERHLSSLGEMSAVLAHEIRNPLASLKGHAQLLAEALHPESREHAKAERTVQEAIRLEELTSDLLSFVRSGKIERRDVDAAKVLQDAASLVDDPRVVIAPTAPLRWKLDPDRMQQVLTNVLSNAVQASVGDTPVEASVRHERRTLVLTVRDHGAGIGDGDAERIFEPFFTRKTRGTGLGMPIARRIVEAHGGRIVASNHPQGGAVFEIFIPEA